MKFEESIKIKAPASDVFSVYADVSNWPDWDLDTLSAHIDGSFSVGTKGKLTPRGASESDIELIEVTRDKSFTMECKLPLCKMHFVHEIEPGNDDVEVINKVVFSGFLALVFRLLIGPGIKRNMHSSLQGLKNHIEGESQ